MPSFPEDREISSAQGPVKILRSMKSAERTDSHRDITVGAEVKVEPEVEELRFYPERSAFCRKVGEEEPLNEPRDTIFLEEPGRDSLPTP